MATDKEREVELLRKHSKEYEVLIEKQKKKNEEEKDEKEVLQALQEDIEFKDETLNTLFVRDRLMNDELQVARRAAVEVRTQAERRMGVTRFFPLVDRCYCGLQYVGNEDIERIVEFFPETELPLKIHLSGSLDNTKWNPAFQEKYGEEWQIKGGEHRASMEKKYTTSRNRSIEWLLKMGKTR